MNWQTLQLLRILLDPRITATPVRVLRALRARGRPRLPEAVQAEVDGRTGRRHLLAFLQRWLEGEQLTRHGGQWVLNSFLPPFPGAAFDRMFENLLSGRRLSPVSAFLAVTASCPYSCWHCSLRGRREGQLSREDWLRIIQRLHSLGASLIGFTGGEPLSRSDLADLVAAASSGGAATIVFSSGALMDACWAESLRRAGLWAFCVSLDHPEPAEHDRLRGHAGAFERGVESLRLARAAGFYTMIGAVATRRLVEEGLYAQLHQRAHELGVDEFRLVEPMPCGLLAGAGEETLLAAHHIKTLREFHTQTNRRRGRPKVCAFNQIESPEIFGCGAGTQHLFIDSAGEVCPCDFTPMSFGNAVREDLETIWRRMSTAMGNPRRHCFIQKHHRLIAARAHHGFPLPPETSCQVCAEAGFEPLPDYFRLVTGGRTEAAPSNAPVVNSP